MINLKLTFYIFCVMGLVFLIYHSEKNLNEINDQIYANTVAAQNAEEEIRILETEWSYQINPDRLEKMMARVDNSQELSSPSYRHFSNLENLPVSENRLAFKVNNAK